MYPPVDYPVLDKPAKGVRKNEEMTYAALLDRHASEEVITEAMIQSACLSIETAQQFPFASRPEPQHFSDVTKDVISEEPVNATQQTEHSEEKSLHATGAIKLSSAVDLNAMAQPAAQALSRWIRGNN